MRQLLLTFIQYIQNSAFSKVYKIDRVRNPLENILLCFELIEIEDDFELISEGSKAKLSVLAGDCKFLDAGFET